MPKICALTHFLGKNKLHHREILTAQKRNDEQINKKNENGITKQILRPTLQ